VVGVIGDICVDGVPGGMDTAAVPSLLTACALSSMSTSSAVDCLSLPTTACALSSIMSTSSAVNCLSLPTSKADPTDVDADAAAATVADAALVPAARITDDDTVAASAPTKSSHKLNAGKRSAVEAQLIDLQQQTLSAVNKLVDIQQQVLDVKKAKLAMKRAVMLTKGVFQDEEGNWVAVLGNSKEE